VFDQSAIIFIIIIWQKKKLEKDDVGAIVALHNTGLSQRQIARQLSIAASSVNLRDPFPLLGQEDQERRVQGLIIL
jgi:hypothetical protein